MTATGLAGRLSAGLLAALLAVAPLAAQEGVPADRVPAGLYRLDPLHSRIAWSVSHLGFSTYQGLIPAVRGTLRLDPAHPETSVLDASIPMDRIGTLDAALDRRLRGPQFFDTARAPTAAYHAAGLTLTGPGTARLAGTLTLCGVSRTVPMDVRFARAGIDPVTGRRTLGFEGAATLRRSLFGVNAYVPLVGDDVRLEIEAEFVPGAGSQAP